MRNASLAAAAAVVLSGSAFATITNQLVGDAYIIQANGRSYSVLDVYVKCGASTDIVSSTFGVSAYVASTAQNQGLSFVQENSTNSNASWLPTAGNSAWDSFLTTGLRDQASTLSLQLDTNWAAGNGSAILSTAGSAGAGWYPGIGANTNTNPYARAGFYNGSTNVAKTASTIAGNNIAVGGSLDNLWMVGRFTIDVTGETAADVRTMTMKFAVAGKNNGVTTVTGATNAAYRYNQTLTFAAVPAPGAAALLGLAGLVGRRRR
jgi:hypothetical protein